MTKTRALIFLTVTAPVILLSFLSPSELALWVFSFATMGFPIALIIVGVGGAQRLRALGAHLLLLALLLELSGFGMLFYSRGSSDTTLLGLPLSSVFMLVGLWLAPLFVVSWAYPRTFSRVVLTQDELDRIRERRF